MSDQEYKFVRSRLSSGYLDMLDAGKYMMCLTLFRGERMKFKHALNLVMHVFRKNYSIKCEDGSLWPADWPLSILSIGHEIEYNHGDLKIFTTLEHQNVREELSCYSISFLGVDFKIKVATWDDGFSVLDGIIQHMMNEEDLLLQLQKAITG